MVRFFIIATLKATAVLVNAQTTVIKSTSSYYTRENILIKDSMFVTFRHFDASGNLVKKEERHYRNGIQQRSYTALFRNEEQVLALYNNGKLTDKIEYDSNGTAVKAFSLFGRKPDTMVFTYIPKYAQGKLTERKVIQTLKGNSTEDLEYYTYQNYDDSSSVTITVKTDHFKTEEKKCYNKDKKLLYVRNWESFRRKEETPWGYVHRYDSMGNRIETTDFKGKVIVSKETFSYKNNKILTARKEGQAVIVKTVYE